MEHFICVLFITIDHSVASSFFPYSSYWVMPLTLKFLLRSVWYWLVEDPFSPRFLLHKGCRLLVLDKYVGEYIGVISRFQVIGWFYQSSIFYINRAFISSALSSVYICFAKHRWASVHMRLYRVCIECVYSLHLYPSVYVAFVHRRASHVPVQWVCTW